MNLFSLDPGLKQRIREELAATVKNTLKDTLRPLYYATPTREVRKRLGRGLSRWRMPEDASARLSKMIERLPGDLRTPLRKHREALDRALFEGTGISPIAHLRACAMLPDLPRPKKRKKTRATRSRTTTDRPLKILFVTGLFPAIEHGGGLRIFDLIRELSSHHEVSLYSYYSEKSDSLSLGPLLPSLTATRLVTEPRFSQSDFESWLSSKEHFDAIHFVWPHVAPLIATARPFGDVLLFELIECVTRRWTMDLSRLDRDDDERTSRLLFDWIEAWQLESQAIRDADRTLAVTADDRDFAEAVFGGEAPVVVPTCVSETMVWDKAAIEMPYQKNTAMFLGFYDHPPNVEGMLWYLREIHPRVKMEIPDYELHIVGGGDTRALRAAASGDSSVILVGRVDEIVPAIQIGRVCLSPLISGAGIRGKINQYSACSRPTVSTSIGVSGTPYQDGKDAFIADDPELFARRVVTLLRDDALYTRMGQAAQRLARSQFSWSGQIPTLLAAYRGA